MMLQGSATTCTSMPSTHAMYACDIPLTTPIDLDWRRHLPSLPKLSKALHDEMLVLCLRSFS